MNNHAGEDVGENSTRFENFQPGFTHESVPSVFLVVPSRAPRALSNAVFSSTKRHHLSFWSIDGATTTKNVLFENLIQTSSPSDGARRVVYRTHLGTLGTPAWTSPGEKYSNMVLPSRMWIIDNVSLETDPLFCSRWWSTLVGYRSRRYLSFFIKINCWSIHESWHIHSQSFWSPSPRIIASGKLARQHFTRHFFVFSVQLYMATATDELVCVKCKKPKSTVQCEGCAERFCLVRTNEPVANISSCSVDPVDQFNLRVCIASLVRVVVASPCYATQKHRVSSSSVNTNESIYTLSLAKAFLDRSAFFFDLADSMLSKLKDHSNYEIEYRCISAAYDGE